MPSDSAIASSSVISSGTGTKRSPTRNFCAAYDDSSLRKSAVQTYWMTASMIAVSPNVASSELSGDTAIARQQPLHGDAEQEEQRHDQRERQQRIDAADARELVAEVRREEREREMREVDDVQQAPRSARGPAPAGRTARR